MGSASYAPGRRTRCVDADTDRVLVWTTRTRGPATNLVGAVIIDSGAVLEIPMRLSLVSFRGARLAACLVAIAFFISSLRAQEPQETITVGDVSRTFVVHLPKGYDAKQHYPVVILLHGTNQDGNDMARLSRFDELADKNSIIAVYPSSLHGRWNVGVRAEQPYAAQRRGPYGRPGGYPGGGYPGGGRRGGQGQGQGQQRRDRAEPPDDLAFLNQMLDKISSEYSADSSRVYAAGLSDGGFMSQRMGCAMSDRVAAIAAVGSAMPKTMICLPSRPVPALMINGTSDPVVKYGGGSARNGSYATLSAEDTAKYWAKINRCSEKPARSKLRAKEKGGMETDVNTYEGCQQNAQVALYSVKGGGNTWPNGEQYSDEKTIGKTSHDLDANQTIWSFFVTRQLPAQNTAQ
jgi:polyhydroxybutyrate depolymerase